MIHPELTIVGNPILATPAMRVGIIDNDTVLLINNMVRVMKEASGIGLAANQIGSNLSIFVTHVRGKIEVFINPEIISQEDQVLFVEGCLSVPGISDQTKRFEKIVMTYQSPEDLNYTFREEFTGLEAIVFQHEVDHLNGKLYIDAFSGGRRADALNRCKKAMKKISRRSK